MKRLADGAWLLSGLAAAAGLLVAVQGMPAAATPAVAGAGGGDYDEYGGLQAGCDDLPTRRGSDKADVLRGTRRADRLLGRDGSDRIVARAGGDCAFGNQGRDVLDGGGDDDTLRGGAGNDILRGGPGVDAISCGQGRHDFAIARRSDDVRSCEQVQRG